MHQFRAMHDFLDLVLPREQKKTGMKGFQGILSSMSPFFLSSSILNLMPMRCDFYYPTILGHYGVDFQYSQVDRSLCSSRTTFLLYILQHPQTDRIACGL